MLEVVQQPDGRYAVRDIGGRSLDDVLAVFGTQREADEWMLSRTLTDEGADTGLGIMKPGAGERIT